MLTMSACSKSAGVSKAGGIAPPLVLRIGTDDGQGRPAGDQIEEFARRVAQLSEGTITVKPVWHAAGTGLSDWDQRVARMVVKGDLEMGTIPARAWDTEGVTSLRALNAPFLITTDELVAQVINSNLADDMMSGLDQIGIVGLALLPEGLRHPFGFSEPLLGPADYVGKTIRTPTSATAEAMFALLGATVTDDEIDESAQAGMESEYRLDPAGTATGNVTFYPKVNSLVVNAGVFAGLDDDQRTILEQAAADTRTWSIQNTPSEAAAALRFCITGQAVVLAGESDLTALQAATASLYAHLASDELTKSLIDSIRRLKRTSQVSVPAPVPCGGQSNDVTTDGDIDGVYRFETTEAQYRAGGADETDYPEKISILTGVYTWTFSHGTVSWVHTSPAFEGSFELTANYTIEGDRLSIVWPNGVTDVYKWSTNTNGDLLLTLVSSHPDWVAANTVATSQPWVRIGDVDG